MDGEKKGFRMELHKFWENYKKKPHKKNLLKIVAISAAVVLIIGIAIGYQYISQPPTVLSVTHSETTENEPTITISVWFKSFRLFRGELLCALGTSKAVQSIDQSTWQTVQDGVAQFPDVAAGQYYVFTKYENDSNASPQPVEVSEILSIALNAEATYLPVSGSTALQAEVVTLGLASQAVTWISSAPEVATVDAYGNVTAVSEGQATITATASNGFSTSAVATVSDLYQAPQIDNQKPSIATRAFTEKENDLLDEILANQIAKAGYGTRAGVVAAARFLSLEFSWFIPYFSENGRLNNHSVAEYVDGEGRYYHQGLFLHESRFRDLKASLAGPAVWGETLYSTQTGTYNPNGLNCSGYVAWCLLNGGFDVGDAGSGNFVEYNDDLCDLGERIALTEELMASDRVKVGDLIGLDGHIGIIIGLDEENIYFAEAWQNGLHVDVYERYTAVAHTGIYTWIVLMDEVYGEDGNLTEMWGEGGQN